MDAIAANELAVHWLQQPPLATQSLQELRLVAQARCAHLHGGRPDDWWVAGDWAVSRPFVCAALPRTVVQPLQDRCDRRGIRVRWHTGWGLLARHRPASMPDEGWCGMRTASRALIWQCSGGHVTTLTSLAIDPGCSADELHERAQVQVRLEAPETAGEVGIQWVPLESGTAGASAARTALALAPWLPGASA